MSRPLRKHGVARPTRTSRPQPFELAQTLALAQPEPRYQVSRYSKPSSSCSTLTHMPASRHAWRRVSANDIHPLVGGACGFPSLVAEPHPLVIAALALLGTLLHHHQALRVLALQTFQAVVTATILLLALVPARPSFDFVRIGIPTPLFGVLALGSAAVAYILGTGGWAVYIAAASRRADVVRLFCCSLSTHECVHVDACFAAAGISLVVIAITHTCTSTRLWRPTFSSPSTTRRLCPRRQSPRGLGPRHLALLALLAPLAIATPLSPPSPTALSAHTSARAPSLATSSIALPLRALVRRDDITPSDDSTSANPAEADEYDMAVACADTSLSIPSSLSTHPFDRKSHFFSAASNLFCAIQPGCLIQRVYLSDNSSSVQTDDDSDLLRGACRGAAGAVVRGELHRGATYSTKEGVWVVDVCAMPEDTLAQHAWNVSQGGAGDRKEDDVRREKIQALIARIEGTGIEGMSVACSRTSAAQRRMGSGAGSITGLGVGSGMGGKKGWAVALAMGWVGAGMVLGLVG